jgi:hypothetical protein
VPKGTLIKTHTHFLTDYRAQGEIICENLH